MSQPASSEGHRAPAMDPFALVGLPRRFGVDEPALRRAALRLLADAHPDRAGTDPVRQAEAARRSAEITAAFRTLASPIARAETLLALAGMRSSSDDAVSPAFLMSMMETREALDEAIARGDAGEVQRVRDEASRERERLVAALAEAFDGSDPCARREALERARHDLAALRYVERVLERVRAAGT